MKNYLTIVKKQMKCASKFFNINEILKIVDYQYFVVMSSLSFTQTKLTLFAATSPFISQLSSILHNFLTELDFLKVAPQLTRILFPVAGLFWIILRKIITVPNLLTVIINVLLANINFM